MLPGASSDASGMGPRWIAIVAQNAYIYFFICFLLRNCLLMVEMLLSGNFDKIKRCRTLK